MNEKHILYIGKYISVWKVQNIQPSQIQAP